MNRIDLTLDDMANTKFLTIYNSLIKSFTASTEFSSNDVVSLNCGANTIRALTALRAKHASHTGEGVCAWEIDGETGEIVDMNVKNIWEPLAVKLQTYKTAVETAFLLLRIDDIVSGSKKRGSNEPTINHVY
ncbi:hypothetical protein KR084_009693 [Drosophila pseudotakahashii]|nr:hypothetical protein KR084_009693 [Drosophila pseudotakahashii]